MHVLIIPSWYPVHKKDFGGSFFRDQAINLNKNGIKVGVIAPALRSLSNFSSLFSLNFGTKYEMDEGICTLRFHGLKFFPFSVRLNRWYWRFLGQKIYLQYIKENGKPDIIHVHSMIYGIFWSEVIFEKFNVPYIITEHSSEFALSDIKDSLKTHLSVALKKAKLRVAVSSSFAKILNDFFKLKSSWDVIPNMVSDVFFNKNNEYQKGQIECNNFHFLIVGNLNKNKNHEFLIKSFVRTFRDKKSVKLWIVGEGPEKLILTELVNELKVIDQVIFFGSISRCEVVNFFKDCDVFLLNSKFETFGVSCIEALAMGKPVISTDSGGPNDIIIDNFNGLIIDQNDEAKLNEAMLHLFHNYNKFNSKNIIEDCYRRFSSQTIFNIYIEKYLKVTVINEGY